MAYIELILILLVVAIILSALITLMMAIQLLRPPRMTDRKAFYILQRTDPSDLGLAFESRDFTVQDQATGKPMKIAGWWIPAKETSSKSVVLLHGYSDAKVGGIAWTPTWQSLGWNVLAIDLRAHGKSCGDHSTAGYFEQHDLNQVIDQLRSALPQATLQLAIFGVSLGATVAAAVGAMRDDLHAVVMESPYSDYPSAIRQHGKRLAMPIEWAYSYSMQIGEKISGAKFDTVRPIDLIPKVNAPLLVIHSGRDTFIPPVQIEQIRSAIQKRSLQSISVHEIIPDAEHTLGLSIDPEKYREMINSFLKEIENHSRLP